MSNITLAADSTTLTINGRVITSTVAGDIYELAPVNDLTGHTNSSDGGVTIHKRVDAGVHNLTLRVQRFSEDDAFLNDIKESPGVQLIEGSAKENFNRDGTDGTETFELQTGSMTTQPTKTKSDTDGNALVEYVIRFRNVARSGI